MQNFAYLQHVDSGSHKTLLVLQFVIEFANIWAQYSPWTVALTYVGFFLICALMSKWHPFNAYSCHCERDASCHMTCNGPLTGTTRVSRYQKAKPIWIYWSKR